MPTSTEFGSKGVQTAIFALDRRADQFADRIYYAQYDSALEKHVVDALLKQLSRALHTVVDITNRLEDADYDAR